MNASDRIREIEEGVEADIRIIVNPSLALDLYLDNVSSAKQEVSVDFSYNKCLCSPSENWSFLSAKGDCTTA
jgi:hypothetical protein